MREGERIPAEFESEVSPVKRGLLTVNFNGALCENSRASMKAACERWGVEFWELNEANDPKLPLHPLALKTVAFELSNYDELLIVDAGTLISSRCPNPFKYFLQGEYLVVVANGNPIRFGDYWAIKSCEKYEWEKLLFEEPGLIRDGLTGRSPCYDPEAYWNSGVILARRRWHSRMFTVAFEICKKNHGLRWHEQTPLNVASQLACYRINLASEKWNFIRPLCLGRDWWRHAYVGNFAGETEREMILPTLPWKEAA